MIRTRNVQNKLLNSISFKWKLLIKLTDNKLAEMLRQDAASRNVLLQCSLKSATILRRFFGYFLSNVRYKQMANNSSNQMAIFLQLTFCYNMRNHFCFSNQKRIRNCHLHSLFISLSARKSRPEHQILQGFVHRNINWKAGAVKSAIAEILLSWKVYRLFMIIFWIIWHFPLDSGQILNI